MCTLGLMETYIIHVILNEGCNRTRRLWLLSMTDFPVPSWWLLVTPVKALQIKRGNLAPHVNQARSLALHTKLVGGLLVVRVYAVRRYSYSAFPPRQGGPPSERFLRYILSPPCGSTGTTGIRIFASPSSGLAWDENESGSLLGRQIFRVS